MIDYVDAYKPLLSAIKAEYEECVDTIKRGRQEAFYLNGKLKAMTSEASTIYNYRKRGDELDQKWVSIYLRASTLDNTLNPEYPYIDRKVIVFKKYYTINFKKLSHAQTLLTKHLVSHELNPCD